jgi:phage terminase large subunit-like protein
VVSADAEKQMGHDPYLVIVDELGSHTDDRLYVSLRSALIKNPAARMRVVSTMGGHEDAPMPTMRRRVLEEGKVSRTGAVLRAETRDSLWLEWAVPEGADIDDIAGVVKPANPRQAITVEALGEHRRVLHEHAFRRLHCNQHLPGSAAYIAAVEWDRCDGEPEIEGDGFKVIGVDAAISSDTAALALVRLAPDGIYHVIWRVWVPTKRDKVPLADVEAVAREWAQEHRVDAVVYDPRFFEHAAQNLEDAGVPVKAFTYKRNAGAAGTLHERSHTADCATAAPTFPAGTPSRPRSATVSSARSSQRPRAASTSTV